MLHIELRRWADVLLLAPLSANTLAKAAGGLCDNLLTCVVRAWDFSKRRLKGTLDCGSPVSRMCHHADSALVAVACDDLHIRMYDIEVRARTEPLLVDPKLYPEVLH